MNYRRRSPLLSSPLSRFIHPRAHRQGDRCDAGEVNSWDSLHDRFEMRRIDHSQAYSFDGDCTNQPEEYFSRLRRGEIGIHHHIAGPYLLRYA